MIDARRLWLAVLVQAINELTNTDGHESQRLRYFTHLWFVSDNHKPASFLWICDELELDPSWLRRRVFAIVDTPVSKHLHSSVVRQFEDRKRSERPALPERAPDLTAAVAGN
jgi:hypothetical protein